MPDFDPGGRGQAARRGGLDRQRQGRHPRSGHGKQLRLVMLGVEKPASKDASGPPREDRARLLRRGRAPRRRRDRGQDRRRVVGRQEARRGRSRTSPRSTWNGRVDMDVTPLVARQAIRRGRCSRASIARSTRWRRRGIRRSAASSPSELAAALAESWPIAGIVADAPQGLVHQPRREREGLGRLDRSSAATVRAGCRRESDAVAR